LGLLDLSVRDLLLLPPLPVIQFNINISNISINIHIIINTINITHITINILIRISFINIIIVFAMATTLTTIMATTSIYITRGPYAFLIIGDDGSRQVCPDAGLHKNTLGFSHDWRRREPLGLLRCGDSRSSV